MVEVNAVWRNEYGRCGEHTGHHRQLCTQLPAARALDSAMQRESDLGRDSETCADMQV